MSEQKRLLEDLTCPITLELFVDPVTLPCCGKACERQSLVEVFLRRHRCPLCNSDLTYFDPSAAAKNVIITGLIDTLQQAREEEVDPSIPEIKDHVWSATVTPITPTSNMAELHLRLENSKFITRPSLFLAVLDRSGSMSGYPEKQVKTALNHIDALATHNKQVKLGLLSYGSDCFEMKHISEYKIDGGTNFRAAFNQVDQYLSRFICSDKPEDAQKPNNVSTVTIVFLTDGQDQSGSRNTLVPEFREQLQHRWGTNPLSVHSVGFGRDCDRELLEMLRTSGNQEGLYRYAEPTDDGDTLCQKLTGIFEMSSKHSTVPITYRLGDDTRNIMFPINSTRHGSYKTWISDLSSLSLVIQSQHDPNTELKLQVCEPTDYVFQRWIHHLTDELATEILALSTQILTPHLRNLSCALLLQNIDAIETKTNEHSVQTSLEYFRTQIAEINKGRAVNLGKLSDLRFASLFEQQQAPRSIIYSTQTLSHSAKPVYKIPHYEPEIKHYSRNHAHKNRNALQEAICDMPCDNINDDLSNLITTSTLEDLYFKDADGNNAIMLAAYCGHSTIVKKLIQTHGPLDLEQTNEDHETAVTLAIKKRGFHHTLHALLEAGATIPRVKLLERYAMEHHFQITASIISRFGDGTVDVDETMTPEYVQFMFQKAKESTKPWEPQKFLNIALAKKLLPLAQELVQDYKAECTLDMLLSHCIPKKPDAPDTDTYLALAKFALETNPELVHQSTTPDQESPLFVACQKGSLPHVKLMLEKKAEVDVQNYKGNTPLWMASFMRYPCIIDELLAHGANINHTNLKGNPPLYGPCTRGGKKIAEQLVAMGADVECVNSNGDTMILLCCRNGQHEVLDYLLAFVDEPFVNIRANIDGFNAIMASAEQDRVECIKTLHRYGIDVNQKTDPDNKILSSATPLHIATYYDRVNAVKTLLQLGANPNETNDQGQTPLHLAVIQGNVTLIKILRNHGTDLSLADLSGNVAMAYCRDRMEVRQALVDPVLDILMDLSKGQFSPLDEKEACHILERYSGVPGILSRNNVVDVQDYDGSTPLIQATLRNNYDLCKTLVKMGASPTKPNKYNMTSQAWAMWLKNKRLQTLYDQGSSEVPMCIRYLKSATEDSAEKMLLFISQCPDSYRSPTSSGITQRMDEFLNTPQVSEEKHMIEDYNEECSKFPITLRNVSQESPTHSKEIEQRVWDARVHVVNYIASGNVHSGLSLSQQCALALWTNNPYVCHLVNEGLVAESLLSSSSSLQHYAKVLHSGLESLPPCTSEVFIGSQDVQRKMYLQGTQFYWKHFASGSTLWKVALENTPQFTSKSHKGVIFIVKSKTGRYVAPHSSFSFDSEVIFLPGTRFEVTNWYFGDVIALAQENIRQSAFGIKAVDRERMNLEQMIESDKSLIIELCEMNK